MTANRWVWLGLLVAYGLFFSWYTSFGGALTTEEIDHYMALFEARNDTADPETLAALKQFMETDTGDDFVMLNAIEMYEVPLAIEGVEPGDSSSDVLGRYMAFMYPALFARASHPVLFGTAASRTLDLMNAAGMEHWTQGAGMRYRSRRDMVEIASNPAFQGSHEFKVAAMQKTIAYPLDPWFHLGDPRLILALLLGLLGCGVSWVMAAGRSRSG